MKAFLITTLYQLLRTIVTRYVDKDLFGRVSGLVLVMKDKTISGDDKRQAVHDAVRAEWDDISSIVVNAIIEITLLKVEGAT